MGTIEPSAGRSTPLMRPWISNAVAMIAPELPADIHPSALPSLHSRADTAIDESGFERTACAGWSSIATTCVDGHSVRRGVLFRRGLSTLGEPPATISLPYSAAA